MTNCFKANEKGHVEKSVDVLRNQIFADAWSFLSLEDAQGRVVILSVSKKISALKSASNRIIQ